MSRTTTPGAGTAIRTHTHTTRPADRIGTAIRTFTGVIITSIIPTATVTRIITGMSTARDP